MTMVKSKHAVANLDPKIWSLSPSGPCLRADVHRVPAGHRARRRDRQWELVDLATGQSRTLSGQSAALAPLDQVNLGPNDNEWASYAAITNPGDQPFTLSQATWAVPPKPLTNANQTIYLFNCLQHDDPNGDTYILQPVLVFGGYPVPPGGVWNWTGGSWAIASFLVPGPNATNKTVFASHGVVTVQPGDQLTGRISYQGQDPDTGNNLYSCGFDGYPSTNLPASIESCDRCMVSLELWNVDDTSQLPPGTANTQFANLQTAIANEPCGLGWQPDGPWRAVGVDQSTVDVVYPS
jgi:hypothetical protein